VKYLIDNDVFFAAIYRSHVDHRVARTWLDSAKPGGWGIAVETYLAAVRLLMNPTVMGSGNLNAADALNVVDTEMAGPHPGRLVTHSERPDRGLLAQAVGHRQVMDFWLVQLARASGARLVTRDRGTLTHWPDLTKKAG
jgi:predicted nucleic acid-binding protein